MGREGGRWRLDLIAWIGRGKEHWILGKLAQSDGKDVKRGLDTAKVLGNMRVCIHVTVKVFYKQ